MPLVIFLIGAGGAIAWALRTGPQRVSMFAGVKRRVQFSDGSTAAHLSRLRATFSEVVDEGNGTYVVTPPVDGLYAAPEGGAFV